ncbi:winged helix-turn-helix transcriptional regulator [Solimicrobium silvestre]|uniref:Putative transcriptional regulator n=1 Tax=Solimicrobium silvestre TaxID=2099400 RepID=A0A2S9H248_9BURK|nr:helix-turn-helix domain-containing protein [Solimicrobium silvestre]PRC94049.1 putative transcriptional regulator [Solimicrobium silvestre]
MNTQKKADKHLSQSTDCDATCPVQRTAKILDGKWTTLIVRDLIGGKKRYSELQRSLVGISPRLLAARLRLLEQHGMVIRTAYPTIPPTTEYELTPYGHGLTEIIEAMARFGAGIKRV